jgi:ABC-type phosphate transport system auxiliary subunit
MFSKELKKGINEFVFEYNIHKENMYEKINKQIEELKLDNNQLKIDNNQLKIDNITLNEKINKLEKLEKNRSMIEEKIKKTI